MFVSKMADNNEDCKCQLRYRYNELLRKEKELKKEKELEKKLDNIKKREISIRRSRSLLKLYWAFIVVVSCYSVVLSDFGTWYMFGI
ncbi:hypothetical protein I3843_15G030300 [Carya illinoinensis]|uniref:Transmembrane protein n=1 Tax=Carya illinoinensis TaxID=32201 RepID=A0A922A5J9_CARIL|nr:hypothetical protein I3842_15G034500 [Carya illinoinensis]KAG7943272.1 hypothetical protein I3843_15G030300 [Carya illinoinensis]KAG7943273.1 hypothetical protein I3843_15G030300 [Carya illinoinensis]